MSESHQPTPGVAGMLGSSGACPEITHRGRTWQVGHPDQEAKTRLEKLAAKVALDEVRRLKDTLDPDAYQEAFADVTRNLKNYRTWRPGWQAVVYDPENGHLFLWSLIQGRHPNVREADVRALVSEAPEEVAAALAQVLPDFFRMLVGELTKNLRPEEVAKLPMDRVEEILGHLLKQLAPTPANTSTPSGKP